jgi:hypothetical protein
LGPGVEKNALRSRRWVLSFQEGNHEDCICTVALGACRGAKSLCVSTNPPWVGGKGVEEK